MIDFFGAGVQWVMTTSQKKGVGDVEASGFAFSLFFLFVANRSVDLQEVRLENGVSAPQMCAILPVKE